MQTFVGSHDVADEISFVDLGIVKGRPFTSYNLGSLGMSYSNNFTDYYKIAGFSVYRSLDHTYIARATYDILGFLGDVGGLDGLLTTVGGWLVGGACAFAVNAFYLSSLFHLRPREKPSDLPSDLTVT